MKKILTSIMLFNLLLLPIQGHVRAEETNSFTKSPKSDSEKNVSNQPETETTLPLSESESTETSESSESSETSETSESDNQLESDESSGSNESGQTETPAEQPEKNGMVTEDGKTYYYNPETGEMQTGWVYIEGKWYYFHPESGELQTGWLNDGGKWYYLNPDTGEMQTGWLTADQVKYYLHGNGAMATGWAFIENKWYYFNQSGAMQTGWEWLGGKWYYLQDNGEMAVGWVYVQNRWYFLNSSGDMVTGWLYAGSQWYYLESSGAMKTGWLFYKNEWYYLKESGAMATGWYIVDHLWYYSYPNGIMARNTSIGGYYLNPSGAWYPDFVNPKQNYSYSDLAADIHELERNYPGFIQTAVIGKSVDGRNLYALKLGKGEKEIFINGSHHAREHMTTNLIMEMIDQYALAYAKHGYYNGYDVRGVLDKVSIWFVPMVNPDGVMLVQEGASTAKNPQYVLSLNGNRTDFSSWKANIRGVDLNRQYPADWENITGNTGKPSPDNFKGYQPLSEPETQAIYNFTLAHSFKIAVAYHSSGRILYWNYKQAPAEYNRDYKIAVKYRNLTGYSLVDPGPNPSGGGYTDWFIQDMKMPGFTPEISTYTFSKPVPIANFDSIWKENQAAGLMLANEAINI